MCGLAAIYSYHEPAPVDQAELLRMREHMAARGPDGAGLWLSADQRLGLSHRRLAILDLSDAGAQPMATPDGHLRIVFNGEIYNYRALREQLRAKGHVFRSGTDTEVLLYAWREYGRAMVNHLRGMFALAIWDEVRRGMFLARDHFGIKPLYYHDDGKTFRVASQVKALLAGRGFEAVCEPAGHVGFYVWGSVPEPYTLYRNLFALPAGHSLWVDECGVRAPERYFDIADELEKAADVPMHRPVAAVLKDALRDSVQHHQIADVPVGIFLSSGLDSTTLTALAAESLPTNSDVRARLQAITLGFSEYEGTQNDEVPLAQKVAAHYGCSHHVGRISRKDYDENLDSIVAAMDQPSTDGVNTWFVAREAKRAGLKVAISGLGGDELLGGYPSFRQIPQLVPRVRALSSIPSLGHALRSIAAPIVRRMTSPKYASLIEYGGTYAGAYLLRRGLFMPWELPRFLDRDIVRDGWAKLQPVRRLDDWIARVKSPHAKVAAMELSCYMRNVLLRDSDWAGMAHSLEIRVPMVDVDVFRALAPYLAGNRDRATKQHLAEVPAKRLPHEVLLRRKTGFSIPVHEWTHDKSEGAGERGLRGWAKKLIAASRPVPEKTGASTKVSRILIYRLGSLGDTVVALPALRLIARAYPNAERWMLTNFSVNAKAAAVSEVLDGTDLVHGYVEYPIGLRSPRQLFRLRGEIRKLGPEVVICLAAPRGRLKAFRDALFFRWSGIHRLIGFPYSSDLQRPLELEPGKFEYEGARLLRSLRTLGAISLNDRSAFDLCLTAREGEKARVALSAIGATGRPLFALSIGAKVDVKEWGDAKWKTLLVRLGAVFPDAALMILGAEVERERSEAVLQSWPGPKVNFCGRLSARESAAALARAHLYLGHDSGPMHLAAAVGVPCVSVFSSRNLPGEWFPFGSAHRSLYRKMECGGCGLDICIERRKACISSITVEEVYQAVRDAMSARAKAHDQKGVADHCHVW